MGLGLNAAYDENYRAYELTNVTYIQGLFPQGWELYTHQREVFEQSVVHGRDVVVTTGTGSGKTECFLLPVLAALMRESRGWPPPGPRPANWDWWNRWTMQGSKKRWAPRIAQRAHENRSRGIRALILYPLNALVEDQLGRLRDGLDGPQARAWSQAQRSGNRFYFGRYTGRTPGSGNRTDLNRLRTELRNIDADARLVTGTDAERFFPRMDGGEMWSRWDMQDDAPDILITNYSMLNIMLMRSLETPIFDQTRQWLQADASHVFHLVVDELHTYRGTPGTEVAYLLRVLIDRIGLSPNSDQLRIIASSASVASGTAGLQYLEEFFGRDRNRFRVIGGTTQPVNPSAFGPVRSSAGALRQFCHDVRSSGSALAASAVAFHGAVGAPPVPPSSPPQRVLESALSHIAAPHALRLACAAGSPQSPRFEPRFPQDIAAAIVPRTFSRRGPRSP